MMTCPFEGIEDDFCLVHIIHCCRKFSLCILFKNLSTDGENIPKCYVLPRISFSTITKQSTKQPTSPSDPKQLMFLKGINHFPIHWEIFLCLLYKKYVQSKMVDRFQHRIHRRQLGDISISTILFCVF